MGLYNYFKRIYYRFGYGQIIKNCQISEEILMAHKFHDSIHGSPWFKNQSVSPGGWAMDYAAFYTVFRILENTHPLKVIEFGLGQMSKMLHQYSEHYPETNVLTIEHDLKWANFINSPGSPIDINRVKFVETETIYIEKYPTLTYKGIEKELSKKYNLIIIDGPFGQPHYSRPQILKMIPSCLEDNWCIIMDDYQRQGEKETCDEVKRLLGIHDIPFVERVYGNIKEHYLLCSPSLSFLTSL